MFAAVSVVRRTTMMEMKKKITTEMQARMDIMPSMIIQTKELTSASVGFIKVLVQHVSYLSGLQDRLYWITDP